MKRTYIVEIGQLKKDINPESFIQYKYNELGYLILFYFDELKFKTFHGLITPAELENLLGKKKWDNFIKGKRKFIINN